MLACGCDGDTEANLTARVAVPTRAKAVKNLAKKAHVIFSPAGRDVLIFCGKMQDRNDEMLLQPLQSLQA